ncbi:ABC transporter permease [Lachnospiraceae bacterium OF09-6]|nr:ABC transporter permease [Lachnospiraceae bacterium OF09-6]
MSTKNWRSILNKYSLVLILLALMAVCGVANENFLKISNLLNVVKQQSVIIIISFGAMLLIICGLLDLAAGSVLALSGVICVSFFQHVPNVFLTILVAIVVAVACNLISALMVTFFHTPPFIATLAVQAMARGAALFYTGGTNLYDIEGLTFIGQGNFLGIPMPVYFMVACFIIMAYLTKQTKFGRSIYAVGGNEEAARASGINVEKIKILAYVANGVLVGLAAVVWVARVNGAMPNGGLSYEFDAMTSTIIGGTSFSGGIGTAFGTVVGSFIVGFLNNIMNLASIDSYLQQVVRGFIIAVAVIWDIYSKEKKTYKKG